MIAPQSAQRAQRESRRTAMRRILKIAAVLLLTGAAWAQQEVPFGWHQVERDGKKDEGVTADLDGDGRPDKVIVLADDRGRSAGAFAFVTSTSRWSKLDSARLDAFRERRVMVVKPGKYATDCAAPKDDAKCSRDVPARLALKHQAVEVVGPGVPRKLFYWDRKSKTFKTALLAN